MATKNVIVHGDSRLHTYKLKTPINCVITDPPYGMAFSSNQAKSVEGKEFTAKIEGDDNVVEAIWTFHGVMGPILDQMADDADIYVFTAWHVVEHWIAACRNLAFVKSYPCNLNNQEAMTGTLTNEWVWDDVKNMYVPMRDDAPVLHNIELKMMGIWEKGDPGMGDLVGNWGCGHEVFLYLKKGRRPVHHRRPAVLHYDKVPTGQNIHPTEKPQGLLKALIEMSTDEGDFVVDPYSGSGSTSLACKTTGRNSLAFEIDPKWIPRSRDRLKDETLFG